MRGIDADADVFELLPPDLGRTDRNVRGYSELSAAPGTKPISRPWTLPGVRQILYSLPLIASIAPVAILLAFSPTLSRNLGYNGCTPSGEFVLPYTSSIWDPRRLFTITIAFSGPRHLTCSYSASDSASLACIGYSFTQVKVIDIVWDILVGRGGQAVLSVIAYRLFSCVVKMLMEQGEVGYDTFSAIAFNSGGPSTFVTLFRHAVGWTPIPRTRHAVLAYWGMALATIYIIVVPSLLAAMTGYTSYYAPFLAVDTSVGSSETSLKDCLGSIVPVWGRVGRFERPPDQFYTDWPLLDGFYPIIYDHPPYSEYTPGPDWIEYYDRYHHIYSQCPSRLNISDCSVANIRTYLISTELHNKQTFLSPMPGIVPYSNGSNSVSRYSHWLCGEAIFEPDHLLQYSSGGSKSGLCRAASGYAWGFSFLLTFIACILNLVFVLIMYALWLDVRRHHKSSRAVGQMKDAVTMVTLAQTQYGPKIGEWSSATLQKKIANGQSGMTFAQDDHLRKRPATSLPEHEFGDPYGGDWGGDVEVAERR